MADETKSTAADAAPVPAPKYPRLRKLAEIALAIALSYIGARFGIPVQNVEASAPAPAVAPVDVAPPEEFGAMKPAVRVVVCDHPKAQVEAAPGIAGKTEYQPYQLVRLQAQNLKPGAAVLWRVSPRAGVDRATTASDRFEFAAVPGVYDVELLVITKVGEGFSTEEVFTKVTVGTPKKEDPKTEPKPDGQGKLDPPAALARIRFGSSGCTATVIGPRRADGRWDVLTANHCIEDAGGVGARGTMKMLDGRTVGVRVVVRDARSDVAWMVTETATEELPYANIAATNPAAGVKVWHAGYGVDVPGNREDGEVLVSEQPDGKTTFMLSVSPGDSGGGILRADTNEVVATVCCTSILSKKARMSAGGVNAIRKLRPGTVRLDELREPTTTAELLDVVATLMR